MTLASAFVLLILVAIAIEMFLAGADTYFGRT